MGKISLINKCKNVSECHEIAKMIKILFILTCPSILLIPDDHIYYTHQQLSKISRIQSQCGTTRGNKEKNSDKLNLYSKLYFR